MTLEGIKYNFKRLTFFLNEKEMIESGSEDIGQFLHTYSRIMDIHGAGIEQYALLLLTKTDFESLKDYVELFEGYRYTPEYGSMMNNKTTFAILNPAYLRFNANSYTFHARQLPGSYPKPSQP
jgi:hypothetical protein